MNKSLWTKYITTTYCPGWECPICGEGKIALVPTTLTYKETAASVKEFQNNPHFDPECTQYRFTVWGRCSLTSCHQKFAIAGRGGLSMEQDINGRMTFENYFYPEYCSPMPHIIAIPKNCPDEIKQELIASFSLFWLDHAACVGRVRVSLELLMDYAQIPKIKAKNKKLRLHDRIELYKQNDPQNGSQLMALKWLGNTGSHESQVSKNDILIGFEILEHTLEEIFENPKEKIAILAKKLEEKHKPKKW